MVSEVFANDCSVLNCLLAVAFLRRVSAEATGSRLGLTCATVLTYALDFAVPPLDVSNSHLSPPRVG